MKKSMQSSRNAVWIQMKLHKSFFIWYKVADTFHEVKRKREKKKETTSVQVKGGGAVEGTTTHHLMLEVQGMHLLDGRIGLVRLQIELLCLCQCIRKWKIMQLLIQKKQPALYQMGAPVMDPNCLSTMLMVKQKMVYLQTSQQLFWCKQRNPVLVPTASQHADVLGTVKCETGRQWKASEINNIQGDKHVSEAEKTVPEVPILMHGNKAASKSKAAEQVKQSNPIEPTSLQVVTSEVAVLTVKANSQLLTDSSVRNGQHVTFPTHFQVSENGLTFGSFDDSFGLGTKHNNVSSAEINSACPVETSLGSDEPAGKPSSRSQDMLPTPEGDEVDQPQSPPELEKVLEPEGNVSSDTELKDVQSTQDPEGNQYGFGLMSASAGPRFDGPEAWAHDVSRVANISGGNSPVTSGTSTPLLQSSVAAAPQAVHLYHQPFPPNYFPYPYYLPPYYMHAMHQYLNMAGIPQQPSTGNLYMPPGVKCPLPQFKPGTNAGNPAHYMNSSGYGPMTPPPVGFNLPVPSVTSGTSSGKEDFATLQLKENHIYTTGPLNEGSPMWIAAPGQDFSNLPVIPLYNISLHGQHVPFSPAQAGHGAIPGLYQSPQRMAPPSNVNNQLQQSQAMSAEAAIPHPLLMSSLNSHK